MIGDMPSLVGIIVALVVLSLADSLLVDLLWFSTLGYRQVFIITLGAQVAILAIVWRSPSSPSGSAG